MASLSTTMAPRVRSTTAGAAGTFYITGLEAATARLVNAGTRVEERSWGATTRAAAAIKKAQRASAPVASEKTRNSIVGQSTKNAEEMRASIGPTHFVARYLVFGTVNMGRKWDLFGASQPGIESWMSEMSKIAGDV